MSKDNIAQPRRQINSTSTGTYNGAELRPFAGRPGALDALELPSLVNGKHVLRSEYASRARADADAAQAARQKAAGQAPAATIKRKAARQQQECKLPARCRKVAR